MVYMSVYTHALACALRRVCIVSYNILGGFRGFLFVIIKCLNANVKCVLFYFILIATSL